jgi:hypothetical protein
VNISVRVGSGGQYSLPFNYAYKPPNITFVNPTNYLTEGGILLSINGTEVTYTHSADVTVFIDIQMSCLYVDV